MSGLLFSLFLIEVALDLEHVLHSPGEVTTHLSTQTRSPDGISQQGPGEMSRLKAAGDVSCPCCPQRDLFLSAVRSQDGQAMPQLSCLQLLSLQGQPCSSEAIPCRQTPKMSHKTQRMKNLDSEQFGARSTYEFLRSNWNIMGRQECPD